MKKILPIAVFLKALCCYAALASYSYPFSFEDNNTQTYALSGMPVDQDSAFYDPSYQTTNYKRSYEEQDTSTEHYQATKRFRADQDLLSLSSCHRTPPFYAETTDGVLELWRQYLYNNQTTYYPSSVSNTINPSLMAQICPPIDMGSSFGQNQGICNGCCQGEFYPNQQPNILDQIVDQVGFDHTNTVNTTTLFSNSTNPNENESDAFADPNINAEESMTLQSRLGSITFTKKHPENCDVRYKNKRITHIRVMWKGQLDFYKEANRVRSGLDVRWEVLKYIQTHPSASNTEKALDLSVIRSHVRRIPRFSVNKITERAFNEHFNFMFNYGTSQETNYFKQLKQIPEPKCESYQAASVINQSLIVQADSNDDTKNYIWMGSYKKPLESICREALEIRKLITKMPGGTYFLNNKFIQNINLSKKWKEKIKLIPPYDKMNNHKFGRYFAAVFNIKEKGEI